MKIRPVGAELFHADGRTDMTKLMGTFRNFAKSAYKVLNAEPMSVRNLVSATDVCWIFMHFGI